MSRRGSRSHASHQVRQTPAVEVRRSRVQGLGVFAARDIPEGRRILEYQGEVISHEEAARRYQDESQKRHHTFLFTVTEKECIDGARFGNEARYINHSCDPNCEALVKGDRIY